MAEFLPGLGLSRLLYAEAVRPLLDDAFPGLPHSAARMDGGSEVLGYDTERSADHEWGPRLTVFLSAADTQRLRPAIAGLLAESLPKTVRGWSTHFEPAGGPIARMAPTQGPVHHRVEVTDLASWSVARLGFDAGREPTTFDWLSAPTQRLAEATAGAVYHDGLGTLGAARARLGWYPLDPWRYVLACQWQRIAQEEAFPGRCAEVGDDLGSRVVGARLVRDLMRLCLLMSRRYPPYGKWLGSAFAALPCAPALGPLLSGAVSAAEWPEREHRLAAAYRSVVDLHNRLRLTAEVDGEPRPYFDRPFQAIGGGRLARALRRGIADPVIRRLPLVGAVDQFLDSTDALCDPVRTREAATAMFGAAVS